MLRPESKRSQDKEVESTLRKVDSLPRIDQPQFGLLTLLLTERYSRGNRPADRIADELCFTPFIRRAPIEQLAGS